MVSVTHYATNVHGQPNANTADAKYRVGWANIGFATSKTGEDVPKGVTQSFYYKENKHRKPVTFTAHDFNFNIPDCAYITNVAFTVRIRCSGTKLKVKAPLARFNIYNGRKYVSTYREDDTGWEDGVYYVNTNKKLTNTWQDITYTMDKTQFHNRDYPVSSLNDIIMGIDLRWYNASTLADSTIYIEWVRCTVDYEMPNPSLVFDKATSVDEPRFVKTGEPYTVEAVFSNRSNAGCCGGTSKEIDVVFPPNAKPICLNGDFDYETNKWTVQCLPNSTSKVLFEIIDYGVGENRIQFLSEFGNYDYWIFNAPPEQDIGEIRAFPQTIQRGVISCIEYHTTVVSNDGEITVNVNVDAINDSAPDLTWSIDYDDTLSDVEIESSTNSSVTFSLPINQRRDIVFKSCFIPSFTGESAVRATFGTKSHVSPYYSIAAPTFVVRNPTEDEPHDRSVSEILLNPSLINVRTHRVATTTELGAYVIDCGIAEYDSNMIIDDCTLTASTWKKLDYIGMIPLEYHHYDPESTYENKAIAKDYKNKSYKGKEGIIDEDISLKFKLRPAQATTLQGLIKLDKPTPINANHSCFEGDVLNHRGWVVLSKAKIKKTNPLWYDVDATVDYITHDINTKFQIFKGSRVCPYAMPDLQDDVFELGANLSKGLDIFKVDTDGGFVYDDSEESARNLFSLDEEQYLSIGTVKPLTDVAKVRFDWYSNMVDEIRENEMSRIFRLKDKDGNAVFEYEYANFEFSTDYVSCNIILRTATDEGGWNEPVNIPIELKTEIDADPIAEDDTTDEDFNDNVLDLDNVTVTDDEEDDEIYDDAYEEGYIAPSFDPEEYDVSLVYGSSLELELNGNQLTVSDAGFNGRELHETFTLPNSNYYFETEWHNNNSDGMTEDIISYIDVGLSETILAAQYSELYSNLIVSPFPIPYRKIVFTRESEEGTIYYMTGEEPFKYRLEPFYQYHCGTDLVTRDGISIFDLNNSYTYFYIENGLVRLGFNKFNGRLYLAKWDIQAKQWVTTHYFQMDNNTKFSVPVYSDDKIVVKAGTDTLFTIWRGHPYVMIENPTDKIQITSKFNYALGDNIDGKVYTYPVIHSFQNTDNILPACIGGSTLNPECLTIEDDDIDVGTDHTISLSIPTTITAQSETTLGATLSPSTSDGEVHYLIDNIDMGGVESPFTFNHTFMESKEYTIQAVYVGDEDDNIAISPIETIIPKTATPTPGGEAYNPPAAPTGDWKLTLVNAPSSVFYNDGQKITLQLTRGGTPVPGMVVEAQLPSGHTQSYKTDENGQVYIENKGYAPGKYQWGGRFYDDWDESTLQPTGRMIYSALKWIEVKKYTPSFKTNSDWGRVSKGKDLVIKIKGKDENLGNVKLTYTVNGGSKKTKTTNSKGNIHIKCNSTGVFIIKVSFAGNTKYSAIKENLFILVV